MYEHINFTPRPQQLLIDESLSRFNVIVCHRRFGKTLYTCAKLVETVTTHHLANPRAMYYCPTKVQAKAVAWDYLKALSEPFDVKINEVELKIDFPNDGRISLGSADRPDRSRGIYLDMVAVDEPAHMPMRLWSEVLRATLAEREGKAIFLGTPAGRHGMLFDLWELANNEEDWMRFMFRASDTGIIPAKELRAARRTMSTSEYNQEWECSFSARLKGAYFGREMESAEEQDRITEVVYDPEKPVHIGLCTGERQENSTWFFQFGKNERVKFLEHCTFPRFSMPDMVRAWQQKDYKVLGKVVVPHPQSKGSGSDKTRSNRLRQLGMQVALPNTSLLEADIIDKARGLIDRSTFDSEGCKYGIECLRQYRADWDDKHQVWKPTPLKNWAIDAANAFRAISITDGLNRPSGQVLDYSIMDRAVDWG